MPKRSHHPLTNPTDDPDLVLTRDAAQLLHYLSVDATIVYLRKQGLIPVVRGRAFLWHRAEVLALLDCHGGHHEL